MKPSTLIRELFGQSKLKEYNDLIDKARLDKKFVPKIPMVSNNVFIGIEVEVENVFQTQNIMNFTQDSPLWRVTEDGSLRNNGKEYVSTPLRGDNIPFALETLNNHLTTNKNCLGHEFTDRTSVHVHVDSRDFTVENVGVFLLSYILVEPLLYRFCGGHRHQNIFCVPLNMTNLTKNMSDFFGGLESEHRQMLEYPLFEWPKYTGLNLLPLTHYGTIEFRHMVGNCDVEKLSIWINLLLSLHRYAKGQSYRQFKERVLNLNTSSEYRLFLYEVFGKYLDYVNSTDLENHMEDMVIFIKDVYSVNTVKYEIKGEEFKDTKFVAHALASKLIMAKEAKLKVKRKLSPELRQRMDEIDLLIHSNLPDNFTPFDIERYWQLVLDARAANPGLERDFIYRHFLDIVRAEVHRRVVPPPQPWQEWPQMGGEVDVDEAQQVPVQPVAERQARVQAPQFRVHPARRNRGE